MKKLLLTLLTLSIFTVSMFAVDAQEINNDPDAAAVYEEQKTTTVTIVPENQHVTDKSAKVTIEYEPSYDEVRIYYVASSVTYDKGEAMNTVLAVLQDFQKEHKYFSYKYLSAPREKSFADKKARKKYTQYYAYVQFTK